MTDMQVKYQSYLESARANKEQERLKQESIDKDFQVRMEQIGINKEQLADAIRNTDIEEYLAKLKGAQESRAKRQEIFGYAQQLKNAWNDMMHYFSGGSVTDFFKDLLGLSGKSSNLINDAQSIQGFIDMIKAMGWLA